MNCTECKEKLVEYIERLLSDEQKQQLESHLKNCRQCQTELEQLIALGEKLSSDAENKQSNEFENDVFNRIIREQNLRLKQADKINRPLEIVRIIMKSKITKLAIAAAIIIAVGIGIYFNIGPLKTNVTFADVIKPIMNARTDRKSVV
jgi:anti-sigma factor RsiW